MESMTSELPPNHYQQLGLDMSADTVTVRQAVDHLATEADRLAFVSPEESRAVWTHVRQIKRDLLSGSERRYAYDRMLLSFLPPEVGSADAFAPPPIPLSDRPTSAIRATAPLQQRTPLPAIVILRGVAVALLLALLGTFLLHQYFSEPHGSLKAGRLREGGSGKPPFPSGKVITLRWNRVPHASMYGVEIATVLTDPSDKVVFQHHPRSYFTTATNFRLQVVGPQLYYWRIQSLVSSVWAAYTPSHHFAVSAPHPQPPRLLLPLDGATESTQHVRMCWSGVSNAVVYRLRISRLGMVSVRNRCVALALQPGAYTWAVATGLHAARLVVGPYAAASAFAVAKPPTATPTPRPTATPPPSVTKPQTGALACSGVCGKLSFNPPIRCANSTPAARSMTCSGGILGAVGGHQFLMTITSGSVQSVELGGGIAILDGHGLFMQDTATFEVTTTDLDPGIDTVQIAVRQKSHSYSYQWKCLPSSTKSCIEVSPSR